MSDEIIPVQNTKQVHLGNCGIVMPISPTDGYLPEHWQDVLAILKAVATDTGFNPLLVSDANDVGIIQKRIIQNLYSNENVICDVSSKNPNVMFELGIRLAFDKRTIIIKDDQTDYSFDTTIIEHLTYPKDLRHPKILKFRSDLETRLLGTWTAIQGRSECVHIPESLRTVSRCAHRDKRGFHRATCPRRNKTNSNRILCP